MKLTRKLQCCYIYTDGTLVQYYHEERGGIRVGDTVDITLGYCTFNMDTRTPDGEMTRTKAVTGRMILHGNRDHNAGFLTLAKGGKIRAAMAHIGNGSENSKRLNIEVQYVDLTTAKGIRLHWAEATGVMCGNFELQDDSRMNGTQYSFPDLGPGSRWGTATVWQRKDLRGGYAA